MTLRPEAAIPDALMAHVAAFAAAQEPVLPVAFPDIPFSPPPGPYLEVTHLPNRSQNLYLADADPVRHLGILQIMVAWPSGAGIVAPADLAGAIVTHFAKGTRLRQDAVTVHIYERPSVAPPLQEPDRTRTPISIRYQCIA